MMTHASIIPPPARFAETCAEYGLSLEPHEIDRLGRYLELLLDANQRMNLTTVTDPGWAWIRHIFDSLTLLPFVLEAGMHNVIDVGTGGGLPGLPLAIATPHVRWTLLDATGKKVDFLREIVTALGVNNVLIVNDRAETAAQLPEHRERYDAAVSRAVGRLQVLIEYTSPFVKVGGHVLAIKGEKAKEEIADAQQALYRLHCDVVDTHVTPTGTIVIIEKKRATPKMYPRRPGEPKRSPIT